MTSNPQAAARSASPVLARLSAQQMLDGYRSERFTPRDVLDEVIVALQATDSLCNVMRPICSDRRGSMPAVSLDDRQKPWSAIVFR
jgi:hypothetical protein